MVSASSSSPLAGEHSDVLPLLWRFILSRHSAFHNLDLRLTIGYIGFSVSVALVEMYAMAEIDGHCNSKSTCSAIVPTTQVSGWL